MRTRSHSKAFRNALLWTWWFPLFVAITAGGVRYSIEKDVPDEWIALGKISLTLPGGQVPDDATVEAHIALLESLSLAERVKARVTAEDPELHVLKLPEGHIKVSRGNGSILNATVSGPDGRGVQAFLNEGLGEYIMTVELKRRDPVLAGGELGQNAVPMILELAGPGFQKRRELWLPAILTAIAAGAMGIVVTLLICSVWAFFRPANTQPSLEEIMKAAAGLDPTARAVLAEWLRNG